MSRSFSRSGPECSAECECWEWVEWMLLEGIPEALAAGEPVLDDLSSVASVIEQKREAEADDDLDEQIRTNGELRRRLEEIERLVDEGESLHVLRVALREGGR